MSSDNVSPIGKAAREFRQIRFSTSNPGDRSENTSGSHHAGENMRTTQSSEKMELHAGQLTTDRPANDNPPDTFLDKMSGGGRSLARTGVSWPAPDNREFFQRFREILIALHGQSFDP